MKMLIGPQGGTSMAPDIAAEMLAFVLIGAVIALLWFDFRNGKRGSKKKKEKPDSTVL
jgi:hypothetical protein